MKLHTSRNKLTKIIFFAAFLAGLPGHLRADVFFLESFEKYTLGPLDADLDPAVGGVNFATNGAFSASPAVFYNPWWGAGPPNLQVVGNENGITPHSGAKMVRGISTNSSLFSQDLYNIGYRLNGGLPFRGNILLDWWFYDPAGSGAMSINYQDSISLACYSGLPAHQDYTVPDFFFGSDVTNRLALGAALDQSGLFDRTKYQAQIVGTTGTNSYDGPGPGLGWINTTNTRSIGWHHARISLSPVVANGTANVSFYLDDLTHPTLTNNTIYTNGFNCVEMDASYGSISAYYDDITFDVAQHATLTVTNYGNNIVLRWPAGWSLQSATKPSPTNFVDVALATSPYTNKITSGQRYIRLRFGNPQFLQIARSGKNYIVTYPPGWILQTTTNLAVPSSFLDVTNATNPYTNLISGSPQFFRARF